MGPAKRRPRLSMAEKKANWVALKRVWQRDIRKAIRAAVLMPLQKFSTNKASTIKLNTLPTIARAMKQRMEKACAKPNQSKEANKPKHMRKAPPTKAPRMV